MVIILPDHDAVTPAGKPVGVPIPVAPVVVCVTGLNGVLIHNVGEDEAADTVLSGFTVTVILSVAVNPFPSVTVTV